MTRIVYEDLYKALKDLPVKPPCGFKVRAYVTKRGEPRAYVELVGGVIDDLELIAEKVENSIPHYSVCIIKENRIYITLNNLSYRIRYDGGMPIGGRNNEIWRRKETLLSQE